MSEINNRGGSASCFLRQPGLSLPVISQIELENSANGNLWIIVLIPGWKTIGREVLFVPRNEAGSPAGGLERAQSNFAFAKGSDFIQFRFLKVQ